MPRVINRGQHDTLWKLRGSPSGAKLWVNVCREWLSKEVSPLLWLQFPQMKLPSDFFSPVLQKTWQREALSWVGSLGGGSCDN